MQNVSPATASQIAGSQQINRSKIDNNFDGYLIFDFHEFQGLISQPDSNPNEERSPSDRDQQQNAMTINGGAIMNSSSSIQKLQSQQDNVRKFSVYNQVAEDQEDEKKSPALHIQGLDFLDKTKDKTNYDEFYTFLMGLDFLNISNSRNRVDAMLMEQFESLLRIKEHFVMLKNHIEKITENDSDLWFDELKNTFKLMLHQFENMINSISEQINPVSLSVCFFRCIEYLKFFQQFLHMRTFHQHNTKANELTPLLKFKRAVRVCLLWKRLTGSKNFALFIKHLDSDGFNCRQCEACKQELKINPLQSNIQYFQPEELQLQLSPALTLVQAFEKNNSTNNSISSQQNSIKNSFYYNPKIFKDILEGFNQLIDNEIPKVKTYKRLNPKKSDKSQEQSYTEFLLADRSGKFRKITSPVCNSQYNSYDFFMS